MKIALVIERMDLHRGGRETSTAQVASGLAGKGCDVTIICQSGSWEAPGVEVLQLGARGLSRTGRLANFAADVEKAVKDRNFDILQTTLPIPCANVYRLRGGTIPAQQAASLRRRSLPGRLMRRITEPFNAHRRRMARYEKQLMTGRGAMCLCVSRMVQQECQKYYGAISGVEVVFNCVDVPGDETRAADRKRIREEIGAHDDAAVFLTVATNYELKGVTQSIEAFAKWRSESGDDGSRLVILGRPAPDFYMTLANDCGVADAVVFVPPTQNVFQWYAAADAVLLLSWYDPCSRVVLEAARWGVPSITTRFNGASEAFEEGGCIVVNSPLDINDIVAAFAVLADPQARDRHSQACLARSDYLGSERHVTELLDAYTRAPKIQCNL
ncbi:MAG: glycosyltransferase family 4 protein [Phycisphaerales bacterium]|jgi:UDP-glucose:(heptosyl)LPS alpha-1,3-glucosyltransferase|nr:glycosyltransferase family 4 protein [Phycisphaerales bacterium]